MIDVIISLMSRYLRMQDNYNKRETIRGVIMIPVRRGGNQGRNQGISEERETIRGEDRIPVSRGRQLGAYTEYQ